jgi:hypothetical protein
MHHARKSMLAVAGAALLLVVAPSAAVAQSAPVIGEESVSHTSETDAVLEAHISTGGLEHGAYYQFQLATDPSEYAGELACPPEDVLSTCIGVGRHAGALPIGFAPGGVYDRPVTIDLASAGVEVEPRTTYHFRLIAAKAIPTEDTTEWEPPTVYGADQTFITETVAPSIKSEAVSHVTPNDATLEAHIGTEGLHHGAFYQFQLVTNTSEYASELACAPPLRSSVCLKLLLHEGALPIGFVASGSPDQLVTRDVAMGDGLTGVAVKLKPNTTYHYRVIAADSKPSADVIEWEPPTVFGADQTFTTPAVTPSIESEVVSHITAKDATLEARINTEGVANGAYYQFQLAADASEYASELACPPELVSSLCIGVGRHAEALPIGFVAGEARGQLVTLHLPSSGITLKPHASYHFRVIAATRIPTEDTTSWEPPTVFGPDQTFTTTHGPRKHP